MLSKNVKLRTIILAIIIIIIIPFNPALGAVGIGLGMIWFAVAKVSQENYQIRPKK